MTDKTIIDGVDVSGCDMRCEDGYCALFYSELQSDKDELEYGPNCADNPNCHFKQLARKTEECEKYKKLFCDFKDVNKQLGYKLIRLKEDIKRSPPCVQGCEVDCEIRKLRQQLQAEKQKVEGLQKDNEELKERAKELVEDCESCNFHKYKQALKKIKYYITDLYHGAKDGDRPYYEIILQQCEVLND